jgi:hypothetical protein
MFDSTAGMDEASLRAEHAKFKKKQSSSLTFEGPLAAPREVLAGFSSFFSSF